nr:MAG TPA: hypothetical protein [Caudoviricetes sp.]
MVKSTVVSACINKNTFIRSQAGTPFQILVYGNM